ncbi:MAG: LCP family protein [Eubacteriales bacterium]|nr:LCP family protein [Eubacteriales bacterium]
MTRNMKDKRPPKKTDRKNTANPETDREYPAVVENKQEELEQTKPEEYSAPGVEIEPFIPTDFYPSVYPRGKKRRRAHRRNRALWAVLIIVGIVLLSVGGVLAYAAFLDPSAQFQDANATAQPIGVQTVAGTDATPAPGATATPETDLYDVISAQADTSMMQNIVNVLLIGVDYATERETWSGKHEYHADVMMVVAINFDENRVDLISLPRDTYAKIPGVKGIYKLNASLNCGGGYDAPGGAGFLKTCEAASWMLGGIPINYYYAVTMPAVKQLVDAVGGVDYNLELSFKMAGRSYSAGPTHLNGQGVLDYLRVRKNIQSGGDLNRVNRQKKMMIALFQSMQEQNLILKIPDILNSFSGQLYTNCTLGQTAALTKFAYTLDSGNIGMYSMTSSNGSNTNIFNWNFCLTDQNKRVQIIQDVYNVDVPKELEYTADYAAYRWADMIATQYLDTVQPLTEYVSAALAADDLLPTATPTLEPTMVPTPETSATPYVTTAPTAEPTPTPTPTPEPTATSETEGAVSRAYGIFDPVRLSMRNPALVRDETYRQYSDYSREMFNNYLMSLDELEEAQAVARKEAAKYAAGKSNDLKQAKQDVSDYASHVKTNALSLAQEFGYATSKLIWACKYETDSSFNEVKVDFR